ncbi:VTT domain-containing protein [Arthrobacter sp. NEB 688]|uniref:TVP38/TMEM64 family protein n=1 Tax=Arthrobacter sp. NEB 688 TaxID=904039 RepID=UPI00156777BC|nr:VTT domain-containing protein [Arthrobacter sp. NEB 688]QKE83047.1 TVP38/TMEM64 family protein [Arthrobacter sp. NEB 688]
MSSSTAARVRLAGLVVGVLLAGGLAVLLLGDDLGTVRRVVADSGAWGPVVYVVLHVVLTLVPVPKNLLAGIAGALFGLGAGSALSWLGAVASAWVTFELAGRLGAGAVDGITGARVERVRAALRDRGLLAVVIARLTPLVPFTLVNWGAGVSRVARRDFVLGTALGVVPGTVAYVAVGASAGQDASTIVLAGGAGVVLLLAAGLLARRLGPRHP